MNISAPAVQRTRESQCDRLLRLLERYRTVADTVHHEEFAWVILPQIVALGIASHTKIISILRETHNIEIERKTVDGQLHVRYKLVK